MNKIMPYVAFIFFALFSAAVVALLMSYTFQALQLVFPGSLIAQIMGLTLFDLAALAWLGAFVYLCKSVMQYAFAFVGFLLGMAGTLGMVVAEVMLGGQELMAVPDWIATSLIYTFIGAVVGHVVLLYAYKLAAPDVSAAISLGIETANITEEAMKQAEDVLLSQRSTLGAVIAPRLINSVRQNLGLPLVGSQVIEGQFMPDDLRSAIPVSIPSPASVSAPASAPRVGFTERVKRALAAFAAAGSPPPVAQYQAVTPAPASVVEPASAPVVTEDAAPAADDVPLS